MKKRKLFTAILCGCASASIFSGCGSATNDVTTFDAQKDQGMTSDDNSVEIMRNDALAVDPMKCIGCGKCVRLAPKNFSMDQSTRKATVISHEIASASAVQQAASACPVHAITQ